MKRRKRPFTRGSAMTDNRVTLGLGLISIGREWGFAKEEPPSEKQVQELLQTAIELGIRFFDTAPAYGYSEERFGRFLSQLDSALAARVFVATKCGIHWDFARGADYDDHSYDALRRSIDQSRSRFPRIDLLQLHRASLEAIACDDVKRAFEHAESLGIRNFGASVKDMPAAKAALEDPLYTYVQMPFNMAYASMEEAFTLATATGKQVVVNRPFGMGQLLYDPSQRPNSDDMKTAAYEFVLKQEFSGVVLTGTKSPLHLRQNVAAFQRASARVHKHGGEK
jgi:aryl-alcohol dehydrogenase-like predicted oxidoreductase